MTTIQDKAHAIWVDVYKQLGEIADQTGCEAGARRAFHDGRFAALKELGLVPSEISADNDAMIRQRRRELDEALRPGAIGEQMAFEPIVRRYPDNMQRLVQHRPDCSLRALSVSRHGSSAMTCTCDYYRRSREQQTIMHSDGVPALINSYARGMTEPESTEAAEPEDAAVEDPADEDADD